MVGHEGRNGERRMLVLEVAPAALKIVSGFFECFENEVKYDDIYRWCV